MNYERACLLLHMDGVGEMDPAILKKQYHRMALKHHPDKNPQDVYATEHFQEIQDAYHYLQKCTQSPQHEINEPITFTSIMRAWLDEHIHSSPFKHGLLIILAKLATMAEDAALDYLHKIELNTLEKVAEIARFNRDVLHLSNTFLDKLNVLVVKKRSKEVTKIVNPTLDDLLNHHLYKMHYRGEVFAIPVWHSVLEYDLSGGGTMVVECNPLLPDHVWMDDHNNLFVELEVEVGEIWDKPAFSFTLGQTHQFQLSPVTQLYCTSQPQQIVLEHCGIPEIQVDKIYDTSTRKHIYVNIRIQSPHCV